MILLDTDVLVDVALDREDHADSAARLLDRVENGEVRAAVAWHSMSNLYYLVAPAHGGVRTRDFIVQLVSFVDVAKTGTEEMRYAAGLPAGRLRGRHAGRSRPCLRRPLDRYPEPARLHTLADPRNQPQPSTDRARLTSPREDAWPRARRRGGACGRNVHDRTSKLPYMFYMGCIRLT